MTDKEHKAEFERLKAQLYQNRVIFHHRRPFLAELTKFDIQKERVAFSVKFVKSIYEEIPADEQNLFDWFKREIISVSSPYNYDDVCPPLVKNSILCRVYCDFMIYFDHDLVQFVSENPPEIAEKVLPYLGPDGNWRQVLDELG
jgi:hypothetical protein